MALEESEPNMTTMKAANEIKQKAEQACKRPGGRNRCTEDIHKGPTMAM